MNLRGPILLARYLALAWCGLVIYASLHPFSGWHDTGISPFAFLEGGWPRYWTAFDLVTNVAVYLPLGFFLTLAFNRLPGRFTAPVLAIVLAAALSFGLEAVQTWLPSRVPSNVDLASNACGGLLGALAATAVGPRIFVRIAAWQHRLVAPVTHAELGLTLLGLWLFVPLSPETLLFGAGDLRQPLGLAGAVPFAAESFVVIEASVTALNALAVGLILRMLCARLARRLGRRAALPAPRAGHPHARDRHPDRPGRSAGLADAGRAGRTASRHRDARADAAAAIRRRFDDRRAGADGGHGAGQPGAAQPVFARRARHLATGALPQLQRSHAPGRHPVALPDPAVSAPDDASTVAWHAQAAADSARHLAVDWTHGLSDAEAAARLARHGPNLITQKPARPAWKRFADQLMQPLVLVLIATGLITGGLGESADASVIFGVVLVNAIIGYWQEAKAEGALAALARSVATPVTVRRSGHRRQLDAAGLVPGDVVVLAAGDRIPADLRLFHQRELHTDDSMLTGESQPVAKQIDPLAPGTLLAERVNMAYAGTTVVAGQGAGLVVGTGNATETGRIAGLIAAAPDLATPLTRKMATFSNWLLWAIGGLAALTFAVGLARGEALFDMFMAAVALAVGAIPEGLPAAVTVTLAIGVARMARRRAIIRHLPAVETLGSTTVICSDKTGTLTENAMTVRTVWCGGTGYAVGGHGYAPDGEITHDELPATIAGALRECLVAGALCNDAGLSREGQHWKITGDPTEAALLVVARKGGLDEHTLQALLSAPGRTALRRQPAIHGHHPCRRGCSRRLCEGRARAPAAALHRLSRQPGTQGAARSGEHRGSRPRLRRARHARAVAGEAGRARQPVADPGGDRRTDAARPGRHDRSAAQGGESRPSATVTRPASGSR